MPLVQRRIGILFAVFLGLLALAGLRGLYLGAIKGGGLANAASSQQTTVTKVPAQRGTITDRKGIPLATSEPADDVSATPYLVKDPVAAANRLAPLIGLPADELVTKLARRDTGFVYLRRGVPASTADRIRALKIEGIDFAPGTLRRYPRGSLAAQVVGATGLDGKGLFGLEYSYDRLLRGRDGEQRKVMDAARKPIEVDDTEIAQMTPGFSGAMIENLLNEATLWGVRHKSLPVQRDVLDDIRQQVVFGTSAIVSRNMSATILERIAVHETGHMLNALLSDHHDKPVRVSINLGHKDSLGHTVFQEDDEDDGIFVREHLDDKVRVLLGGRAAEEIVYGHQSSSTGSTADLEMAFQLARRMIMEFGMGKHIVYPFLSEDYKKRIDEDIHAYIHKAHQSARQAILQNMGVFRAFIRELLVKGTLLEEEIQEIFRTESS